MLEKNHPFGWSADLAEREGFEPSMGFKAHTPLAGEPLQPLGHLSGVTSDNRRESGYDTAFDRIGKPQSVPESAFESSSLPIFW